MSQVLLKKNLTHKDLDTTLLFVEKTVTTEEVRRRIDRDGERFWRLVDFRDLPSIAVAKALSRLAKVGHVQRLSKGIYYRARPTIFGQSRPNLTLLQGLAAENSPMFPSGLAAASLLGFTTQVARHSEVSTSALSLPRKLLGQDTVVHTMRPTAWNQLSPRDAALLEFLRVRGQTSELSANRTVERLLACLSEPGCFEALMKVATSEPPRVRAMLGAIGQQLAKPSSLLCSLRASLNPLSRFDFGALYQLQHAKMWYARKPSRP